jgi:hypothetical protein
MLMSLQKHKSKGWAVPFGLPCATFAKGAGRPLTDAAGSGVDQHHECPSRMVTMMMVTATARAQTAGSDHRQYDDDDQRSTSSVVILNEQAWSRSSP